MNDTPINDPIDVPIEAGKVPIAVLGPLLGSLPHGTTEVRVGPALGEDACAIDIGGELLVAAADPITLTGSDVGRFAVIVNANDVAVMGAVPRWFLATLLFPIGTTPRDVDEVFSGLRRALDDVGAALVGGHTEVSAAVRTTVVAGTMLGIAPRGRVVTSGGAMPGDAVVQIGLAPLEGAAVFAAEAPAGLERLEPALVAAAAGAVDVPGINVVDAALLAADLGASAMHDPTEGGLASGLHEVANASGIALHVDRGRVRWFQPALAVCEALGADPWATLASGCVLATFPPELAAGAIAQLEARGFDGALLGEMRAGSGVFDEEGVPIPWPARDEVARLLG
jgi:hydrogenase expression/formation protein HypE